MGHKKGSGEVDEDFGRGVDALCRRADALVAGMEAGTLAPVELKRAVDELKAESRRLKRLRRSLRRTK